MPILQSDEDIQIRCDSRYPHMDAECDCCACRVRRTIHEAYSQELSRPEVLRVLHGLADVAGSLLAMLDPAVTPSFHADVGAQIDRHRAYQVGLERLRMAAGEPLMRQEIRSLEQAGIVMPVANFSGDPNQPPPQVN